MRVDSEDDAPPEKHNLHQTPAITDIFSSQPPPDLSLILSPVALPRTVLCISLGLLLPSSSTRRGCLRPFLSREASEGSNQRERLQITARPLRHSHPIALQVRPAASRWRADAGNRSAVTLPCVSHFFCLSCFAVPMNSDASAKSPKYRQFTAISVFAAYQLTQACAADCKRRWCWREPEKWTAGGRNGKRILIGRGGVKSFD